MTLLSQAQLTSRLSDFLTDSGAVLFSGAGVGKRANLPDWEDYILQLATAVEPYELETADLMRKRLAAGHLAEAAHLFKTCPRMPQGERLLQLAAPFSPGHPQPEKLRALMALPFAATVTTNFDRTQHDAYSQVHEHAPQGAEIYDPSLKEAIYNWSTFFIARIHGRAEVPSTLILTDEDFKNVSRDADYCDFLKHILTRNRCLFLGFSFLDPAINTVLDLYKERVGPTFPKLHLAVLPKSADLALLHRLPSLNIEVVQYEDDIRHSTLWHSIRDCLTQLKDTPAEPRSDKPKPHEAAKRLLAITFARHRLGGELEPLREVVVDGLVLGLMGGEAAATFGQLAGQLRSTIGLTQDEAADLLRTSLDRLSSRGWVKSTQERFHKAIELPDHLSDAVHRLIDGIKNRLLVRYGERISTKQQRALGYVLQDLILLRGWELGAEFSTGRASDLFTLSDAIDTAFASNRSRFHGFQPDRIRLATRDLIHRPTEAESSILNRLARVAFGVQLALDRGVSMLDQRRALPERVYLDASVLLPAIVSGHPLQPAYLSAIGRLTEAAKGARIYSRVLVLEGFLNEVVSHRDNARTMLRESGLSEPQSLARFIDFVGAENTNVFVGGYSSFVKRKGPDIVQDFSFDDYLEQYAPYGTEERLSKYLQQYSIETVSAADVEQRIHSRQPKFFEALRRSYEEDAAPFPVRKAPVLIRHEARQLSLLATDLGEGLRSIFVTADTRLRMAARGDVLSPVADTLFSRIAFLQLVDLLAGFSPQREDSLARLLWAVEAGDAKGVLRGYLIDRGLREYDAGLASSLPRLAEHIADSISDDDAELVRRFERVRSAGGARGTLDLLDRYEEKFFAGMAAEIDSLGGD